MLPETICKTLDDFLHHVRAQAQEHGRSKLVPAEDPRALLTGFASPTGIWLMGPNTLRGAFKAGPLEANPEVAAKLGASFAYTRGGVPDEAIPGLYAKLLQQALEEGEAS